MEIATGGDVGKKLSIGGSLREMLAIYGAQAGVLLLLALAVTVVSLGPEQLFGESAVSATTGLVFATAATVLFQGVVVSLVSDLQDGRRTLSTIDLLRSLVPVALPLLGAGALAFIAIMIGTAFFVVPGLIFLTIWAVIVPVIVLERAGAIESFGRSQALIRGHGDRVFGVILPILLVSVAGPFAGFLVTGSLSDTASILIGSATLTITTPLIGLASAVLYFRLRAIEEQAAESA